MTRNDDGQVMETSEEHENQCCICGDYHYEITVDDGKIYCNDCYYKMFVLHVLEIDEYECPKCGWIGHQDEWIYEEKYHMICRECGHSEQY